MFCKCSIYSKQFFTYIIYNNDNLFVAHKSSHKFDYKEDANEVLIYNYNPVFTGKEGGYFEQS